MSQLDSKISELSIGAQRLSAMPLSNRRELINACMKPLVRCARDWVKTACTAKRIADDKPIAAEEILAGPVSLLRYLRLLSEVLLDEERSGVPQLPGKLRENLLGRTCVPVLPVGSLYDSLIFMGLKAEVWLQDDADRDSIFENCMQPTNAAPAKITGILGAGNVSAIPATDMLYKIFHSGEVVLLKLNPVNAYLEPFFNDVFRPLIDANLLRIILGDRELGEALVHHGSIDSLHLTGSHLTHETIIWGADENERTVRKREQRPIITKPVTSELGNVTPWIIVPGRYTARQLRSQAGHIVASIVNNASFNCVATKIIVTSRGWPQREKFLALLDKLLQAVPVRFAHYPGARERFERATGHPIPDANDGSLPWTLIRDTNPSISPHLFEEESFVCVCAETALDESSPDKFLDASVEFVNHRLFGTLCATLTIPTEIRNRNALAVDRALERLRYGSVCINQWSGVVYGLMTPPWGGFPGATVAAPQSGIGHVHNTFCLKSIHKTVLWGPLCSVPKPVWFASHRTAHEVAWKLLELYEQPALARLPALFYRALCG